MQRKNKSNRDEYSKNDKKNSKSSSYSDYRKNGSTKKRYVKSDSSDEKSNNYKTDKNKFGSDKNEKYHDKSDNKKFSKRKDNYKKQNTDKTKRNDKLIRLNRYIAQSGICSRREADNYIKAGVVKVNGKVVNELGAKISPTDKVTFNDQRIKSQNLVYVLLNKPKDYITTLDDPHAKKKITDLVRDCCRERIYPVGRLDRYTTGVLLLTNDGDLTKKLTHPKYKRKKIYEVTLDKNVTRADMEKILSGIELDDGWVNADKIAYADSQNKKVIGIELHSGRNRIVRRIFEHLGYRVNKLDRVFFAGLTKKGLARGKWRFLSEKEVNFLKMG